MVTVHHLENSRSQRILWLLEELGTEYEVVRYERDKKTNLAPAELQKIHPLGKSPVITDGSVVVAETGAIIEYLVDKYPRAGLAPARGTPAGRSYTYWLHYGEGTVMPLMVMSLIMSRISSAPMPFFAKPIARGIVGKVRESYLGPNTQRNLKFMNDTLTTNGPWFCGDAFSAADIMMSFPIEAAEVRTKLTTDYPRLAQFLQTIRERDTWQRALAKGGPYNLLS